jgi:hypothetical protein
MLATPILKLRKFMRVILAEFREALRLGIGTGLLGSPIWKLWNGNIGGKTYLLGPRGLGPAAGLSPTAPPGSLHSPLLAPDRVERRPWRPLTRDANRVLNWLRNRSAHSRVQAGWRSDRGHDSAAVARGAAQ